MPELPDLATSTDMEDYGFDPVPAGLLARASSRIRRHAGRQQITSGESTVELYGIGPWLLPQRPVVAVLSVVDAAGEDVDYTLEGQYLKARRCAPLTVTFTHGYRRTGEPVDDHPLIPDELVELACSVASRLASTPKAVAGGARTEQAGAETVTWGADGFAGTTGLTSTEKKDLAKLYPRRPRTVHLL